jgi:hypothetical protein
MKNTEKVFFCFKTFEVKYVRGLWGTTRESCFLIYNRAMSQWASNKKRRILIIAGILVLGLLFFIFVQIENNKVPTCLDGIQNGGETGIDCGGACTRLCQEEARNIVTWWERPFKVSHGVYNAVAYIENQNLYSGLVSIDYEFKLYDENNILVSQPVRGSSFIEPNKRTAIFESGITTGDTDAHTAFFHILSYQDWQRVPQEFSYNLFNISEPVLTNQDTIPKLSASVENKSFINFTDVPVVAILYNQKGNAIASSQTYLDTINQGTVEKVFYSWPEPFGDSVSRIEIIPRVNPYTN